MLTDEAMPFAQPADVPDESGPDEAVPDWVKDPARAYKEIKKVRAEAKTLREEKLARGAGGKTPPDDRQLEALAQTLQGENEALKSRLADLEWNGLRARVASEMGLPAGAASRLVGENEDDLRADAETLKALMSPSAPPQKRPSGITPAPSGKAQGETDEQRRARLKGRNSPIFDKRG